MLVSTSELDALRVQCEENFWFFAKTQCDEGFFDNTLHKNLCDFLQTQFWKVSHGVRVPNNEKVIILPRGFIKTTIIGLYLLWKALKDPERREVVISNTATNAEKTVSEIMGRVDKNDLVRALWPKVLPSKGRDSESWSARAACLTRKKRGGMATFEAIGVGGSVVRRHWDTIVEDDTIAPKKDDMGEEEVLPTQEDIKKAINFHKLTTPLKVSQVESERIVIGTRWAEEDLLAFVKETGAVVFDVPALLDSEGNPTTDLDNGIPTYPKQFPLHVLKTIKDEVGTFLFQSLYLNAPMPKEFMSFKQSWIRYWETFPTEGMHRITVDPADPPTGGKFQDYSAIVSARWTPQGLSVKRYIRERMTTKDLINKTLDMAFEDGAIQIRVEVNRHPYLENAFYDEMAKRGRFVSLDCFKVARSKDARIMELLPLFESGRCFLPSGANHLETELLSWPHGKHDDIIDALSAHCVDHKRTDMKKEERQPAEEYVFSVTLEEIQADIRSQIRPDRVCLARHRVCRN